MFDQLDLSGYVVNFGRLGIVEILWRGIYLAEVASIVKANSKLVVYDKCYVEI